MSVKIYSVEQRVFLVLKFHRLEHIVTVTKRKFQKRFNVAKAPVEKTIQMFFVKFKRTGSVADDLVGHVDSRTTVVTPENVVTVFAIVQQQFRKFDRRIAAETSYFLLYT